MSARRGLFTARDGDGTGATPQDARLALAGLLPTVGVLAGLTVTGSSSGASMKYNVSAGAAACARGAIATDGVYLISNDGTYLVDSGAASPASGSRWDIVWIRPRNTQDGFGDPTSLPDINVTVGVASASSPTKPYSAGTGVGGTSVPAGALVLAESLVGANIANAAAATITRVAKPTGLRGSVIKVATAADYPSAPQTDDLVIDATLGLLRYDGSNWRPTGRGSMQMGKAIITGVASLGSGLDKQVTVQLDAAIFGGNVPSNVQLTGTDAYASWFTFNAESFTPASNQMVINGKNVTSQAFPSNITQVSVFWIAYK